jgi:hypothetical protein
MGSDYDTFQCAPGLKLEAHERLSETHRANQMDRIHRLEVNLDRVERRLWLALFGICILVLAGILQAFLIASL